MGHTTLIFLDIDGVMNRYGHPQQEVLDEHLVGQLNRLQSWLGTQVVFNSAWNSHSLDYMKNAFAKAGHLYPATLIGQTGSCAGGGDPVRDYLIENDLVGTPFIIIDDGDSNYGEMWCRLVRCDPNEGFTDKRRNQAEDLIWQALSPREKESRETAVKHLVDHAHWLATRTHWLTPEDRERYIRMDLDLVAHCLLVPDFLEQALLVKPTASPESE